MRVDQTLGVDTSRRPWLSRGPNARIKLRHLRNLRGASCHCSPFLRMIAGWGMMIVLSRLSAMLVRGHSTGAKVGTLCASRNVGRRCASCLEAVAVLLPCSKEAGLLRVLHEESVTNTPAPTRVRRHPSGVEAKFARRLVSAERSTRMFVDRLQRCSSLHKLTGLNTPPASDIVAAGTG